MADLTIDIVTPERLVFSGSAREIRVPGALGEFGVLPGHTIFLSLLRPGIATIDTAGGAKRFIIGTGFAEAGADRVVLLTDTCEEVGSIDKAKAQQDLADAEVELLAAAPDSDEWKAAADKAQLAAVRLSA